MAADDNKKTTVIYPLGFDQFERTLQGISGAPLNTFYVDGENSWGHESAAGPCLQNDP